MKIYTNENNTSTLKLLIAANLNEKIVSLEKTNFEAITFPGPRQLPVLEVNDQLVLFSSNAATEYLLPTSNKESAQSQQLLEWEATRLQPAIATVLSAKSVAPDLKQSLETLLLSIENYLQKNQYLLSNKISAADIAIYSTIYPLYYKEDLKKVYIGERKQIQRWFDQISSSKAVKDAIKQWGWSPSVPVASTSVLGIPQIGNVLSPVGSPEEAVVAGPTAEEIQAAKDNWANGFKNIQPLHKQEKIVLPVKGRKNVLITSALPYVNNVPHLGNIIGCVLSADIFARYCRLCDYNTLFVCGTDEYGTATETKALEEKLTPREICDKYFEIHNAVYRWFNIGFDYFGRTTTKEQTEIAQKLFLKLHENGFISSLVENQLFCDKCQRFLADRFVEGTCPHPGCEYDSARGDQCDKCGKLVTATELRAPRCKVCGDQPRVSSSENLCMMLDKLEPSIRSWIARSEKNWSAAARAATRSWLKEPLRQRAITRDLKWGVKVPMKGYENKVFYVWFDAPIGYMSITQNATSNYEAWWKPDKEHDITYYQFMAKDNVPFHVIMFPATILGVNEGHKLVNHIYATEYLNYEEGKFSKSRGVGVFGTDALDTGIPADVWRFYLASVRPEGGDSSFSWAELGTRNNSELLNNLGNFCHRSLTFCYNSFSGKVPEMRLTDADYELVALVNREVIAYVQNMERGKLRDALKHVMSISRVGNQHMQATQPWLLLKGSDDDKVRGATAIGVCCQLVALLCTLLSPYIPETCRKLRQQLNVEEHILRINPTNPSLVQSLPPGHVINKPEPLFSKLEPTMLEALRGKYAGTQDQRAQKANGVGESVADLEKAIAEQGDKVRKLKSSTKEKTVWQPEVEKLLQLKKQLEAAQKAAKSQSTTPSTVQSTADLEQAVSAQADKVRQLKASTKDKTVWQPEVDKLLQLKKLLAEAQKAGDTGKSASAAGGDSVASLEKQIAEQGDKVRKLKSSTKDKAVWQPEVNVLLDLKKRLAALQTK